MQRTIWAAALSSLLSIAVADSPFVGGHSCNSASCHGKVEPRRVAGGLQGARLNEHSLFQEHDPHAKAATTLASATFKGIIDRLTEGQDSLARSHVYRRCAECHDPEGMAAAASPSELAEVTSGIGLSSRGIGCESCHGGAKDWLSRHYERDVSRSSLVAAGMRDTKSLQVRAELCAACHVGNAEQDVNHDMLAAGHPPLRFELAAYHRKLTSHDSAGKQSHWNDGRERIANTDFEVKLWEAGQIASAKGTLTLLESRAHRAALAAVGEQNVASWPEFAEYDCFGCHQRLRPVDVRPLAAGGFPEWKPWTLAWLETSAGTEDLKTLRAKMRTAFISDPDDVKMPAARARQSLATSWLQAQATSSQLLQRLAEPGDSKMSWEALCQRYLAQRVLEKSIGDEFQKQQLAGRIGASERIGFNREREAVDRALNAIAGELAFERGKSEWPRLLTTPQGIDQVESALTAAAGKLRKLHSHVEPDANGR